TDPTEQSAFRQRQSVAFTNVTARLTTSCYQRALLVEKLSQEDERNMQTPAKACRVAWPAWRCCSLCALPHQASAHWQCQHRLLSRAHTLWPCRPTAANSVTNLYEIDHWGERLTGCPKCNRWQASTGENGADLQLITSWRREPII